MSCSTRTGSRISPQRFVAPAVRFSKLPALTLRQLPVASPPAADYFGTGCPAAHFTSLVFGAFLTLGWATSAAGRAATVRTGLLKRQCRETPFGLGSCTQKCTHPYFTEQTRLAGGDKVKITDSNRSISFLYRCVYVCTVFFLGSPVTVLFQTLAKSRSVSGVRDQSESSDCARADSGCM